MAQLLLVRESDSDGLRAALDLIRQRPSFDSEDLVELVETLLFIHWNRASHAAQPPGL